MTVEKRWVLKSQGDCEKSRALSAELGLPEVLSNLLVQRGIDSLEKAEEFFNPKLENLHDPFLMKDMDKAVDRIEQAVLNKEPILVYGDYDVDGTTAVALMYLFLNSIVGVNNIQFYIPDRYHEGYGVSRNALDYAAEHKIGLIIALDCGIKAIEEVDYANSLGIDFIICDHHLAGEVIPRAVAVLDPKRDDCPYPFKELSGCGVGFKLAQAYSKKNGISFEQTAKLLDYLVVSIASDIVPITGENRILAYYGLERLNNNPSMGLKTIIKICNLSLHKITIDDIVFKIGPRINAAGRMINDPEEGGSASGGNNAVKLLISRTEERASKYGTIIDDCNTDRKVIDRTITTEANKIVDSCSQSQNSKCTIVYNKDWMKGVVGIVASRLIERYYRPTVVLTMSNDFITGSARSIPGFDLYQAIEYCSDLLENFGGHTYAAGLTMKPENYEAFKERFEKYVNENIDDNVLIPQIEIDLDIDVSDINLNLLKQLNRFQPFGPGNNQPIFRTCGVTGNGRKVGKTDEHLKLDIDIPPYRRSISGIAFGQSRLVPHVLSGSPFDICYAITENRYRGNIELQLRIGDIKASSVEE